MNGLSRDLTLKEKIVLLVLVVVLMLLGYFYFIDQPIKSGIASSNADYEMYSSQAVLLENKRASLEAMKQELESMDGDTTYMPSYNASKQEIDLLNNVLRNTQDYSITFTGVTRDGNQIRRSFTLQFVVNSQDEARTVLQELSKSELRCLIGDLYFSSYNGRNSSDQLNVNMNAVFYETMVGGTADSGLPAESSGTGTNTSN